jgi:hypothetical protein
MPSWPGSCSAVWTRYGGNVTAWTCLTSSRISELCNADVVRQALRIGLPQFAARFQPAPLWLEERIREALAELSLERPTRLHLRRINDNWLAGPDAPAYGHSMSTQEIAEAIMGLPEKERLDLARRIVADVVAEREVSAQIARAVGGIEDVVAGRVRGLSEEEFRDAIK